MSGNLLGGQTTPYRNPCNGTELCWMGPKYQHARFSDLAVPWFEVNTKIPNWNTAMGQPATVVPFERPAIVADAEIDCEAGDCSTQFMNPPSPPCNAWGTVYTMVEGQVNTAPAMAYTQPNTISKVTVNNGGTGYTDGATLGVPGGTVSPLGATATLKAVVDGTGAITKVIIVNGGQYFANPAGSITPIGGGGTGANLGLEFSGAVENLAVCERHGWKGVQARRMWHGMYGFQDVAGNACASTAAICSDDSTFFYEAYQAAPSQIKYLTRTCSGSFTIDLTDYPDNQPTRIFEIFGSSTNSVDPDSGVIIQTSYSFGVKVNGEDVDPSSSFWSDVESLFPQLIGGLTNTPSCLTEANLFILSGNVLTDMIIDSQDINGLHAHLNPDFVDEFSTTVFTFDSERSNTSYTETIVLTYSTDGPSTGDLVYTVDISLSDENPASDVYADVCDNLLNTWMLDNDLQYPWRTDLALSACPLMTRLEKDGAAQPNAMEGPVPDYGNPLDSVPHASWAMRDWFDPGGFAWYFPDGGDQSTETGQLVQILDGSVQGAPKPAGYKDYFRFDFENWRMCLFDDGTDPAGADWYIHGWGKSVVEFNSDNGMQIPLCATQWGNNHQNINKPAYAYLMYGDATQICIVDGGDAVCTNAFDTTALWACKYAEIKESWPSLNTARPAGMDKFVFDETKVYCVTNVSGSGAGSSWTLVDYAGNTPPSLDLSTENWGGMVVDGFYSGCTYSVTSGVGTVVLGTKVFHMPSDWLSASQDDDQCFGAQRWPTAPAILGRAGITADVTGKVFTFDVGITTFGLSIAGTEPVDLYDQAYGLVASNITALRIVETWVAGTGYAAGHLIVDSSGNVQQVTTAGVSGGSTPGWTTGNTADGSVIWKYLGSAEDIFSTTAAHPTAVWMQIHGAANWYFNDQQPKGDFVMLQSLVDNRTNGERARLIAREVAIVACGGGTITIPAANDGYADFSQQQHCLPFHPCNPRVACFSPNAENFPNGLTIAFPEGFALDEQYFSRWQGVVQFTMQDPLWQTPHRPCGGEILDGDGNPVGPIAWLMAKLCDADNETQAFYKHVPVVEAQINTPNTYGPGKNESPPDPFGLYENLAWLSPVTNTGVPGIYTPPIYIGYADPGTPKNADIEFGYWQALQAAIASAEGDDPCRFDYSDQFIP